MISNPPRGRTLIREDRDIRYAFIKPDNKALKKMIEDEFGGELLAENVASGDGSLYRLPPRNPTGIAADRGDKHEVVERGKRQ